LSRSESGVVVVDSRFLESEIEERARDETKDKSKNVATFIRVTLASASSSHDDDGDEDDGGRVLALGTARGGCGGGTGGGWGGSRDDGDGGGTECGLANQAFRV